MNREIELSRHLPFAAVLLLAAILRTVGLGWGIPTPDFRHTPFHPDERWAMRNLTQINLKAGDLNPEAAQGEGAFHYYIWIFAAESLEALGIIEEPAWGEKPRKGKYANILYVGRILNLFYEAVTIFLIYAILIKTARRRGVALVGAGVFAILPFEVIYSHYARTHVMANTFVAAIIFLAFKLYESEKIRDYILIGLITGLAIASRWPTGFALLIPLIIATTLSAQRLDSNQKNFRNLLSAAIMKNRIIYAFPSLVLGVLAGNPSILLSFASVHRYLRSMLGYTDASQFSFVSLFDLGKLWEILWYLIPYGTLPFLWALIYLATVWSLACRAKLKYTVPLFCFALSYLYLMGKGYPSQFIRLAMPSFPVFAILTAFGIDEITKTVGRWRLAEICVWVVVMATLGATCLFSFDYVVAMSEPDPRVKMHRFIKESDEMKGKQLALYPSGWNYFLANPALADLPDKSIQTREAAKNLSDLMPQEYLLLADFQSVDQKPAIAEAKKTLKKSEDYELIVEFDNTPKTMRWVRKYLGPAPHDMQYPFPVLSLFRHL